MLIKTARGELVNLDNITGIFKKGGELVCYIPSIDNDRQYQEFYLGVNNPLYIARVISAICNTYKQTLVATNGNMTVPNVIYEIPANWSFGYFNASEVSIGYSNEKSSQKIITGNRLYVDHELYYAGKRLRTDIDYTAIYPLYRGKGLLHTVIYTMVKSKTLYYVSFYSKS